MITFLFKWLLLFHPFYASLTEVNFNAKDHKLEIGIRMFTSDLETTLQKNNPGTKIDLLKDAGADKKRTEGIINRYIITRFRLAANGRSCTVHYVGYENVEENTWCYFEVKEIASLQKLHISNTVLYDWQPGQNNLHVVKNNGKEKTYKLQNPDSEVDFSF